jgi:PAS domain S-box-containing protein
MTGATPDPESGVHSAAWSRGLAALLAAVLFALDVATPLGIAAGVPYVAVVLLSLRLPRSREVLHTAVICSLLTLLGMALSPEPGGTEWWKVAANRALALFAIWATAILGRQAHSIRDALRTTRDRLADESRDHAAALAEDQARLSGIIQSAMDGIITLDEDQKVVVFNRAAEEIFRTSAAAAIGRSLDQFIPARSRERHRDLIRKFGGSGETNRGAGDLGYLVGLRADGMEFPMEIAISQVDVGGERLFTAIVRDVTEQIRSKQELAERAEQEAVIAELGQRALLGGSLENLMQECAETLSRTLDVEYTKILELLPDETELRVVAGVGWKPGIVGAATVSAAADSQAGYTLAADQPVVVADLSDEKRFSGPPLLRDHGVRSGMSVVILGEERPYGVLGVHTRRPRAFSRNDVDFVRSIANFIGLAVRRARAEDALRLTEKRSREIEELASISTVTAGIAHDVGTPMNIIMGYADMLERGTEDPKARERAVIIKEQVGRIVRLTDTLLNMARPRKGLPVEVDLARLLESSLAFYQEKLKQHAIRVERDFPPVPSVRGNPDRLQQVFLNLFVNAVDAMVDGGTLSVSLVSPRKGEVEIRVNDSGSGIDPENLARVFEPFFTTKKRGEGNGLGLLVSKSIVLDHGGSIAVHSEPGAGTEVRIQLPAAGGGDLPAGDTGA